MTGIPQQYRDLFEKPTLAHVTTMLPDGWPHTTPVWVDYDPDGDREHTDELAGRYMSADEYPDPIESERVILRIRVDDVFGSG